jgi:hypothetical protein
MAVDIVREKIIPVVVLTGMGAGLGASVAATGAWTTYSVAYAALFGGLAAACPLTLTMVGGGLLWNALGFIKDEKLQAVTQLVLTCLAGAALTAGIATLAGFTVTLLEVALFTLIPQLVFVSSGVCAEKFCPNEESI